VGRGGTPEQLEKREEHCTMEQKWGLGLGRG
jgi:hypothetical protein